MKLHSHSSVSHRDASAAPARGFTLPEILIAVSVFSILVAGVMSSHLFGLSMFQITETKLKTTEYARRAILRLTDEIRSAKSILVGDVASGVFQARLDGELQKGSGILIYPTTNTTNFIIYFFNSSDQTFRRTRGTSNTTSILARSVTNSMVFGAHDFLGNVQTNNQNHRVIHLNLEFYQPKQRSGHADYYKLESSASRRAQD